MNEAPQTRMGGTWRPSSQLATIVSWQHIRCRSTFSVAFLSRPSQKQKTSCRRSREAGPTYFRPQFSHGSHTSLRSKKKNDAGGQRSQWPGPHKRQLLSQLRIN